jgi:hypothetical protein
MIKHTMIATLFGKRTIYPGRMAIFLLLFSLTGLAACKKTVVQQVNQVYSATYTIKSSDWASSNGGADVSVTLQVPEIDKLIVANGGVLVYLSLDNGASFEQLPEEINGVSYDATHTNQAVTISYHSLDGTTPPGFFPGTLLAKVVLLDGSPL